MLGSPGLSCAELTGLCWPMLGYTGVHCAVLCCAELYWAALVCERPHRAVLCCTGLGYAGRQAGADWSLRGWRYSPGTQPPAPPGSQHCRLGQILCPQLHWVAKGGCWG